MSVNPIPGDYQTVIPYLLIEGAAELTAFLIKAFDAKVRQRLDRPDGSVMHVELVIYASIVMIGEPLMEFGPMPSSIYLYVEDCDAIYQRALQAGAISVMPPTDMPHAGERYGGVKDPSGNLWWVATHIEDVSPEEQARRVEALTMEQIAALAKQ